jgi:hypothetical protein
MRDSPDGARHAVQALLHEVRDARDESRLEYPEFSGLLDDVCSLLERFLASDRTGGQDLELAASRATAALTVWRSLGRGSWARPPA